MTVPLSLSLSQSSTDASHVKSTCSVLSLLKSVRFMCAALAAKIIVTASYSN